MTFDIRRKPDYFIEFIKTSETMLKVTFDITPVMVNSDIETIIYLLCSSLFNKVFCDYSISCFNKRKGHIKISVNRVNKNALIYKFKKNNLKVLDLYHGRHDPSLSLQCEKCVSQTMKLATGEHLTTNVHQQPTANDLQPTILTMTTTKHKDNNNYQ